MVLLLNLLLPAIILVICWVGSKYLKKAKTDQDKLFVVVKTIFAILFSAIIYSVLHPSYLPKGTAPAMSKVPIEHREFVV